MPFSKIISIIITLLIISASKGLFKNRKKTNKDDKIESSSQKSVAKSSGYFNEAYNLYREGNTREALTLLKQSNLHDVSSYILLGELYYELKEYDLAAEAYKKSIRYSGTAFAYSRLGEIYEFNELYKDAIKQFKKALKFADVQKGFVYHKLGNLYMYTGAEELSDKIFEKAENFHAEGNSTKLTYDFTRTPKKSPNKPAVLMGILALMIGFGVFALIMYVPVGNQVIEEVTVEVHEETVVEVEEEIVEEIKTVESSFGNTNSNINYGGYITEYDGHTYGFEDDGILKINENENTSELILPVSSAIYVNVLENQIFYINYEEEGATVNYHHLEKNYSISYEANGPWNLLVDEQYLYFLEEGETYQSLRVEDYVNEIESVQLPLSQVGFMNQTENHLIFLNNGVLYKVRKDTLMNQGNILSEENVLYSGSVIFVTVEEDYIYFIKENDTGIYRMTLDGTDEVAFLENYDYNSMTLNVYDGQIFIGVVEEDAVYTDIFSIDGEYVSTIYDIVGNQLSNDYLYWYEE